MEREITWTERATKMKREDEREMMIERRGGRDVKLKREDEREIKIERRGGRDIKRKRMGMGKRDERGKEILR